MKHWNSTTVCHLPETKSGLYGGGRCSTGRSPGEKGCGRLNILLLYWSMRLHMSIRSTDCNLLMRYVKSLGVMSICLRKKSSNTIPLKSFLLHTPALVASTEIKHKFLTCSASSELAIVFNKRQNSFGKASGHSFTIGCC